MNREPITIYCYPRSGSTWLCQMLADYLDCQFTGLGTKHPLGAEGQNRTGNYVVYQTHKLEKQDGISILVTRDPRDISVSANHYWQINDLGKTIEKMAKGLWPLTHGNKGSGRGWGNFMNTAMGMRFDAHIEYADLLGNTVDRLDNVLSIILGPGNYDRTRIVKVVDRQGFESRKTRVDLFGDRMPYGKVVQERHLRKGVAGDWKNHYTKEHGKLANTYWKEWISCWEMDLDWWKKLPNER